jgi:hypothetical protein
VLAISILFVLRSGFRERACDELSLESSRLRDVAQEGSPACVDGSALASSLVRLACDNRASRQPFSGFGIFPVFKKAGKVTEMTPERDGPNPARLPTVRRILLTADALDARRAVVRR